MSDPTLRNQSRIDAAAWDVFARHQPYYHVLSDPRMLDPGTDAQEEFWASGDRDVRQLMEFGGLSWCGGIGVDFGCGLGRLTRALENVTDTQIGLDVSAEMVAQATALHTTSPTSEFRVIEDVDWPVASASATLVISLLVFNHLSTVALMEHSLKQMGRVLKPGGHAVFGIQTMTRKGEVAGWLRRLVGDSQPRGGPKQDVIRAKLATLQSGQPAELSEDEIFGEMFRMEFRRLKSIGLGRLHRVLDEAGLRVRKELRDRTNGGTLVAVVKMS